MTLTKDFACLQCKYHPTWRKSLCPLNLMGVVAHHLLLQLFPYNKRFSFPVYTPIILADIFPAISVYSRMRFTFDRGVGLIWANEG
jgi:hypothetical protein